MCLEDYSITAHHVLLRRNNGVISHTCHCVWLPLFCYYPTQSSFQFYSVEKAISASSLIKFTIYAFFKIKMQQMLQRLKRSDAFMNKALEEDFFYL